LGSEPHEVLDLRNFLRPVALLEVTNVFRELLPSEVLEVIVGDLDTRDDLLRVLKAVPHEIIDVDEQGSFWRILVKKGEQRYRQAYTLDPQGSSALVMQREGL